jgi:hypothetical protein
MNKVFEDCSLPFLKVGYLPEDDRKRKFLFLKIHETRFGAIVF